MGPRGRRSQDSPRFSAVFCGGCCLCFLAAWKATKRSMSCCCYFDFAVIAVAATCITNLFGHLIRFSCLFWQVHESQTYQAVNQIHCLPVASDSVAVLWRCVVAGIEAGQYPGASAPFRGVETHPMPVCILGSGHSGLAHKFSCLVHVSKLEVSGQDTRMHLGSGALESCGPFFHLLYDYHKLTLFYLLEFCSCGDDCNDGMKEDWTFEVLSHFWEQRAWLVSVSLLSWLFVCWGVWTFQVLTAYHFMDQWLWNGSADHTGQIWVVFKTSSAKMRKIMKDCFQDSWNEGGCTDHDPLEYVVALFVQTLLCLVWFPYVPSI